MYLFNYDLCNTMDSQRYKHTTGCYFLSSALTYSKVVRVYCRKKQSQCFGARQISLNLTNANRSLVIFKYSCLSLTEHWCTNAESMSEQRTSNEK